MAPAYAPTVLLPIASLWAVVDGNVQSVDVKGLRLRRREDAVGGQVFAFSLTDRSEGFWLDKLRLH